MVYLGVRRLACPEHFPKGRRLYHRNPTGHQQWGINGGSCSVSVVFPDLTAKVGPKFLGHIAQGIQHGVRAPDAERVA